MAEEREIVVNAAKDDEEIEALIQRELDALEESDLDNLDVGPENFDNQALPKNEELDSSEVDIYEHSISQYLDFIKRNDKKVDENIAESQQLMQDAQKDNVFEQDAVFTKKLKILLDEEDSGAGNEDLLQLRSDALAEIEKDDIPTDQRQSTLTVALYQPDLSEEITKLEEEQSEKLKELLCQQEEQKRAEDEALSKLREDIAVEEKELDEKRAQKIKEIEMTFKKAEETEKVLSKVEDIGIIEEIEKQLQEKMKEIELDKEKEEKEFLKLKAKIEEERSKKRLEAVLTIQKLYRGYKARKVYGESLLELRRIRKEKEQKKLEEMVRAEEKRRKEEEKRRLEKIDEERRKREKIEKERLEKERLEKERLELERFELERLEKERLEKEGLELERLEKERLEKERLEKERLEKERLEKERLEKERLEKERLEKERLEKERLEKERLELERLELERLEKERLEKEGLELERLEKERLEKERLEKERLEKERLEKERLEKERLEKERLELERLELERLEKERLEKKRIEDNLEKERLIKKKSEKEMMERDRSEEWLQKENMGKEKLKVEIMKESNGLSEQSIVDKEDLQNKTPGGESQGADKKEVDKLPEHLEDMRKQWAESHSRYKEPPKEDHSKQPGKTRSRIRLKTSLESLPEVDSALISKGLPENIHLQSCQCIVLNGLDGLRLKGIDQCPKVKVIKVTNCGIEAIECTENLHFLEKLDLSLNKIDSLSLSFNTSLRELSLRGNNLTSTAGMEQLVNLEVLDLSSNRITRVGQASACKRLRYLDLSENDLISLKGVEALQSLTDLRASCNHLGNAKEVEHLPLLTSIDLHSNSINSLLKLNNHVLLRDLDLHENDIASLDAICEAWLPSLQRINFAGNSINELPSMNHLLMLQSVDLRDNIIKDSSQLLAGVSECKQLLTLRISGNPVNDTPGLRRIIEERLPSLLYLDDIMLAEKPKPSPLSSFEELCIDQSKEVDHILKSRREEIRTLDSIEKTYFFELKKFEIERRHHKESVAVLLRHLKQHEYFGLGAAVPQPGNDSTTGFQEESVEKKIEANDRQSFAKHYPSGVWASDVAVAVAVETEHNPRTSSVVESEQITQEHCEKGTDDEVSKSWTAVEENAAIKIQANFRGFRVRKILLSALQGARQDLAKSSGYDDDDDDDDFNYDQEVDLTAFEFNDDGHDWRPTDSPQLPSRIPVLPSTKRHEENQGSVPAEVPKFAWQSFPRTPEPSVVKSIERLNLELSPEESDGVSTAAETVVSKKKEELISEWGFQNSATADLMLKRAKKMNAAIRKKNLLGLAADKRYELFRKLQEAKPNMRVHPPSSKKKPNNRVEYFSAQKGRHSQLSVSDVPSERNFKHEMTYSWVCNQAVLHSEEHHDIIDEQQQQHQQQRKGDQKPGNHGKSTSRPERISLPYLDPAIIAGKNLPLVIASRVASNPALASVSNQSKGSSNVGEVHSEKSRSAPNPSQRSPHAFTGSGSSSSRSSSSDSRRRKRR